MATENQQAIINDVIDVKTGNKEESGKVYCYMDKLADMIDSDNSYIRTRGLTLIAWDCQEQAGIKRRYRFRTTKGGYIYLCRKYAVIGL